MIPACADPRGRPRRCTFPATLDGGPLDNRDEKYYLVGLNLEYRFNPHFAAHVGYNYDKLESEAGRSFDRNRVYIGVTASY